MLLAGTMMLPVCGYAESSTCYGTTSNGWLENGMQLPASGFNFEGYSTIARIAGRTYVHSEVKEIILAAYKNLEQELPEKKFKYAESGFRNGGQFKPHKTHQNGLSVDFMVPVLNAEGVSVYLPTHVLNRFGYDIEFDRNGKFNEMRIDFEALAAHLVQLHKEAKKRGYDLWRVIFDPGLQSYLYKTKFGAYLQQNILIPEKRSWVRHDDHYHVDFSIPCKSN
jgi:penicillin-insensitive murein endopeptidase